MRNYDEVDALMRYVWRNYPHIMRPHECIAPSERVCDALPPELREEFWQHQLECGKLADGCRKLAESYMREGICMDISPDLPELRPELLAVVGPIRQRLEKQIFWEKFLPHKDEVSVHRCPHCEKILVNDKSRQCLWCHCDWH